MSIARPLASFALALALFLAPSAALAGGDWNDAGIDWKSYEDGLAAAKAGDKPLFLVLYTDWCPHCTAYSAVFHEQELVDMAKKFVMVKLNKDQHQEVSAKYDVDGQYIPRTFVLSSDGTLQKDIKAPRADYQYFYNYSSSKYIIRAMQKMLDRAAEGDAEPEPKAAEPEAEPAA